MVVRYSPFSFFVYLPLFLSLPIHPSFNHRLHNLFIFWLYPPLSLAFLSTAPLLALPSTLPSLILQLQHTQDGFLALHEDQEEMNEHCIRACVSVMVRLGRLVDSFFIPSFVLLLSFQCANRFES